VHPVCLTGILPALTNIRYAVPAFVTIVLRRAVHVFTAKKVHTSVPAEFMRATLFGFRAIQLFASDVDALGHLVCQFTALPHSTTSGKTRINRGTVGTST
jgi:hypothetical protein